MFVCMCVFAYVCVCQRKRGRERETQPKNCGFVSLRILRLSLLQNKIHYVVDLSKWEERREASCNFIRMLLLVKQMKETRWQMREKKEKANSIDVEKYFKIVFII